jgi:peptidoglycan/LPS O-acetylase OafA/YrhL
MTPNKFLLGYRPELDGIRAIAVLAVMTAHSFLIACGADLRLSPIVPILLKGGVFGVDIFFVLSGFLITSILLREYESFQRISFKKFYFRRTLRLLPAMMLLLAGCIIYVAVFQESNSSFGYRQILAATLYISNIYVMLGDGLTLGMLTQTWSLSVEEQFYTVWPLALLFLIKGYDKKTIFKSVAWIIAASWAFRCFLYWQGGIHESTILRLSANFFILSRTDGLMCGALAAMYVAWKDDFKPVRQEVLSNIGLISATILGSVLLFAPSTGPSVYYFWYTAASIVTATLIVALMLAPIKAVQKGLSFAPLTWIGKISYVLYLFHVPIYVLMPREFAIEFPIISFCIALTIAMGFAAISYYLIEIRFLRMKSRLHPGERL